MRWIFISLMAAVSVGSASAADVKAGQSTYQRACRSCHGPDGAANPAIAKMMKVEIEDLKSSDVQSQSDSDLKKIITDGKGKMRSVPSVSGSALDDVVVYIRSLKK